MEQTQDRIRKLRDELKMDQQPLADLLGLSRGSISNYENGRLPKAIDLIKLSKFFDVSVEYLLCLSNERRPAGGQLGDSLTALHSFAGDAAITASDIVALINAAHRLHQKQPTESLQAMRSFRQFVLSLTAALEAAAKSNDIDFVEHANKAASATLDMNRLIGDYFIKSNTSVLPVAAHGGGITQTTITSDPAMDKKLLDTDSDQID